MAAGAELRRRGRQIETVYGRLERSFQAVRRFETLQRRLAAPQALPGSRFTPNTMAVLRMQSPDTLRLSTHTAERVQDRLPMAHFAQLHRVFELVNDRRTLAARWWLHDAIEPATPQSVRGLDEALSGQRRRADKEAAAGSQTRAGLRYRHRCAADAPGQLVTACRRVPRGPNTRLLTSLCQQAG